MDWSLLEAVSEKLEGSIRVTVDKLDHILREGELTLCIADDCGNSAAT